MGIFENSHSGRGGETVGRWNMLGRVLGSSLSEQEIRRREMATAQNKAEIGAQTIKDGVEKSDDDLRMYGAAMVAAAVMQVEDPQVQIVPPEVTQAVMSIAASLPLADVIDNPYISDQTAHIVTAIVEESEK